MIAADVERRLRLEGSTERAARQKAYLKSDLDFLGVSVPGVRSVVREVLGRAGSRPVEQIRQVAARLWVRPVFELRLAAVVALETNCRMLDPGDVAPVERYLRESGTWALVDLLAVSVMGDLFSRHPDVVGDTLDDWAVDPDFWIRRSAVLALLAGLRRGEGDWGRFTRYADSMLDDTEFFVRKALGWVLRETAKSQPSLVADWVEEHVDRMSGVTFREAVRRLPDEVRRALIDLRGRLNLSVTRPGPS